MAFTEDFGAFFDESDFAVSAKITLKTGAVRKISIIFDAAAQGVTLYDTHIEANTPQFQCKNADLKSVKTRDTVLIENKNYSIERIEPDGTGVSTVYLKT